MVFAGYRNPHPLENHFLLRIQTDGSITPADALTDAINKLLVELTTIEEGFKVCLSLSSNTSYSSFFQARVELRY